MSVYVDFDLLQDVLEMRQQKLSERRAAGSSPPAPRRCRSSSPRAGPPSRRGNLLRASGRCSGAGLPISPRAAFAAGMSASSPGRKSRPSTLGRSPKEKILVTTLFGVISLSR